MLIGTADRSADDDYEESVDFGPSGVFDGGAVASARVAVSGGPGALLVGPPAVAANVVTFRVSGGAPGDEHRVTVVATNGTDTLAATVLVRTGAD